MEIAAGAALLLVGLYFVPLGRRKTAREGAQGGERSRLPAWADTVVNALIAFLCIAFGIALLFGQAHFLAF